MRQLYHSMFMHASGFRKCSLCGRWKKLSVLNSLFARLSPRPICYECLSPIARMAGDGCLVVFSECIIE